MPAPPSTAIAWPVRVFPLRPPHNHSAAAAISLARLIARRRSWPRLVSITSDNMSAETWCSTSPDRLLDAHPDRRVFACRRLVSPTTPCLAAVSPGPLGFARRAGGGAVHYRQPPPALTIWGRASRIQDQVPVRSQRYGPILRCALGGRLAVP